MEQKKVTILVATYNGSKFLREQLDSLIVQTYSNIRILIRDDGSSDNTLEIIDEYMQKDDRISFYNGSNLGSAKCFFDLLCHAPKSDYYAFCDQDDVWEPEKINAAVQILEQNETEGPLLYVSNLKIVDQDLNYITHRYSRGLKTSNKYFCLTEFLAVGCTQVFNFAAAELVRNHLPTDYMMHDAWMYMSCMFFGRVIYDHNAYILYRQHTNNVIGYKAGKITRLKEHFKRLFDRSLQPRLAYSKDFLSVFDNMFSPENKKKVYKVAHYKDGLFRRMSLLFDGEIRSSSIGRDFRYRMLIIFGII